MTKFIIYFFSFIILSTGAEGAEQKLKRQRIKVGEKVIWVEVARSPEEMARGLMFRKNLKPDEGMLFAYNEEDSRTFWMKNTFIPLSIGFFNRNRELIDVQEMVPVKSEMQLDIPTYTSRKPAQYALEMPPGWFKKIKSPAQAKIKFEFID